MAATADRIVGGEDALAAIRDFLDVAGHSTPEEIVDLIWVRPKKTGDIRIDALLAGLAEHLSATNDVTCPAWVREPDRFLDQFWFVSRVPGFRAMAIAQTPIALKRRGVFWPSRSLSRV
jgi:hypothetical protein